MTDTTTIEKPLELPPDVSAMAGGQDELACPDCDFAPKPGLPAGLRKAGLTSHRKKRHGYVPPAKTAAAKATTKKAPAQRAPRVGGAAPEPRRRSAAKYLGPFWLALAKVVPSPRAQQAMIWELPAAGPILDKLAAGSFIDRHILQRLAKEEERWGDASSLLMLPTAGMMVDAGMYDSAPPVAQRAIEGVVEDSIVRLLGAVLDDMARRQKELDLLEAKARAAGYQAEVDEKTGIVTPAMRAEVNQMMALFFARPPAQHVEPVMA